MTTELRSRGMSLNIFTSMYWYIRLSRYGLVLKWNKPLEEVYKTEHALRDGQLADWNKPLKKNLKTAVPRFKKNRLLSLGPARFYLGLNPGEVNFQLDKIRKLLE